MANDLIGRLNSEADLTAGYAALTTVTLLREAAAAIRERDERIARMDRHMVETAQKYHADHDRSEALIQRAEAEAAKLREACINAGHGGDCYVGDCPICVVVADHSRAGI